MRESFSWLRELTTHNAALASPDRRAVEEEPRPVTPVSRARAKAVPDASKYDRILDELDRRFRYASGPVRHVFHGDAPTDQAPEPVKAKASIWERPINPKTDHIGKVPKPGKHPGGFKPTYVPGPQVTPCLGGEESAPREHLWVSKGRERLRCVQCNRTVTKRTTVDLPAAASSRKPDPGE